MTQATDMVTLYIAAEKAVLDGKSVTLPGGTSVTLDDLAAIRSGRREWERRVMDEDRQTVSGNSGPRHALSDFS